MAQTILEKLKILENSKKTSKFWNITWQQGVILSNLVSMKNPQNILEIGTSNGFSTLFIIKELKKGSIVDTIEVNEERFLIAKKNFEDCNIDFINQYLGEAFEVLPKLNKKYDFLFIDAAHQFYKELLQKLQDFNLLSEDYTIVFDNVSTHKHLNDFIEYVKKSYFCEHIDVGGGFLVVKTLLPS